MMRRRSRVLCLDIEGGFGGSSRSLFEILQHMDRSLVDLEVWCRDDGPVRARYDALGIRCRVSAGMPKMNSLERLSRNIYGYGNLLRQFWQWLDRSRLINDANQRFDLIHFNHEGLFGLAAWLRQRHAGAQTMHVRTMMLDNVFGRWQSRMMGRNNDGIVFITENERDNYLKLARHEYDGTVIYNVVAPPRNVVPHPAIPQDGRLKVASLSNYAHMRGVDRLVDVAEHLARSGRRDILFLMAGKMNLPRGLPGDLAEVSNAGGSLADYARIRGVADMFIFLGHVAEPETVLVASDVMVKPTRFNNPWGRDILEAMACAKPVIAIGVYDRFVRNGETGYLRPDYSAGEIADILLALDADRELARQLGKNGARMVADLCDGRTQASKLLSVWREAMTRRARNA
jgi:glycosyltransferase involved in cell wall biosynthesis